MRDFTYKFISRLPVKSRRKEANTVHKNIEASQDITETDQIEDKNTATEETITFRRPSRTRTRYIVNLGSHTLNHSPADLFCFKSCFI